MGMFSIEIPGGNMTDAIFRMEPATAMGLVSPGANTCHDISTLMPERLPLAASASQSCGPDARPIVISPLTTLATLIGESQVEDVLELPAGLLGSDTLRPALDGDLDALRIMRREVQVKSMVSMVSSAVTSNQSAYPRIAQAAFRQLGNLFASNPLDASDEPASESPNGNGITSRRMLLQSSTAPSPEALALAYIFQGVYATLAADPEINLSDMTFVSNDTILAVATSIATFNDLSDSLASSVEDVYRMVILMESQLLPAIQSLAAGNTTPDEFLRSNTLDMMVRSFEETSLPEGSIPDPLSAAPLPAPAPGPQSTGQQEQGSNSSLKLGLGLGLGLGLPVVAAAAALIVRWRRRAATRHAESAFVSTAGLSGGMSSRVKSHAPSPAVAEIVAASASGRSPNANVV